jgi:hypothetical protein
MIFLVWYVSVPVVLRLYGSVCAVYKVGGEDVLGRIYTADESTVYPELEFTIECDDDCVES